MIFLAIRTDKPDAELYVYNDARQLAQIIWTAHRQLSVTIHKKIEEVISQAGKTKTDIDGLVIFEGPGSFTGLRIGFSVANALAYAWQKPIVASGGEDWLPVGRQKLSQGLAASIALPEYGAPAVTTSPKK